MALLEINNLSIQFGGLRAVDDFNLRVEKGELYGLIGPNGAGKSTTFKLIQGLISPDGGEMELFGKRCPAPSVQDRLRMGTVLAESKTAAAGLHAAGRLV